MIAEVVADVYNVDIVTVDLCFILFSVLYLPFNFVAIKMIDSSGIRRPIMFAAVITIIGAWMRLLIADYGFGFALIGSCLIASVQPFILNSPSKVATVWFGDDERSTATAIGLFAFNMGNLVAFVLPSFYVN